MFVEELLIQIELSHTELGMLLPMIPGKKCCCRVCVCHYMNISSACADSSRSLQAALGSSSD